MYKYPMFNSVQVHHTHRRLSSWKRPLSNWWLWHW